MSPTTVYRYRGIRPALSPAWRTFLRLHAPEIWASDFFTVQTLAFRTLYVFVVISHERRRIEHWHVTAHPTAPWVWRQVIEATAWSRTPRFWIRDRDTSYGRDFITKAARIGTATVVTPVRAPQANSIAERVIGTLRRECLDHVIVHNERHLAPGAERVRSVLQRRSATSVIGSQATEQIAPRAECRAHHRGARARRVASRLPAGGLRHDRVFVPDTTDTGPRAWKSDALHRSILSSVPSRPDDLTSVPSRASM